MDKIITYINRLIIKIHKWFLVRKVKAESILDKIVKSDSKDFDSISDLDNSPYKSMAIIRMKEASMGDVEIALDGDSRIHFGEPLLETIPGVKVFAIGGCRTDLALARIDENALLANPRFYISDDCGNDFLGGATVDEVFDRWEKIYTKVYDAGVVKAAWINPPPPGHPEKASMGFLQKSLENKERLEYAKKAFVEFEKRVKESHYVKTGFVSIVDVKSGMTDEEGWQKEKYCAPDRIHHVPIAYTEHYIPKISEQINKWRCAV